MTECTKSERGEERVAEVEVEEEDGRGRERGERGADRWGGDRCYGRREMVKGK